jgi:hypothetical protein
MAHNVRGWGAKGVTCGCVRSGIICEETHGEVSYTESLLHLLLGALACCLVDWRLPPSAPLTDCKGSAATAASRCRCYCCCSFQVLLLWTGLGLPGRVHAETHCFVSCIVPAAA